MSPCDNSNKTKGEACGAIRQLRLRQMQQKNLDDLSHRHTVETPLHLNRLQLAAVVAQ